MVLDKMGKKSVYAKIQSITGKSMFRKIGIGQRHRQNILGSWNEFQKHRLSGGGNYFVPFLEQGHKGWLVWDKGQHGLTMSDCELAYTSFDSPTRVFVCNRVELLRDGTIHPTQKPIALYEWIFSHYAKEGDRILDTHLGSGSSRIAAYNLGLDFVGCELDKFYFECEEKRFEDFTAQQSLFY